MAYCILKQKFGCIEINYCNSGIKNRQIKNHCKDIVHAQCTQQYIWAKERFMT